MNLSNKTGIIIGLLGAIFLFSDLADAHQLTEKDCRYYISDIVNVIFLKNNGYTKEKIKEIGMKGIEEHKDEVDFYVRDEEDIKRLMETVDFIYATKIPDTDVINLITKACLKRATSIPMKTNF